MTKALIVLSMFFMMIAAAIISIPATAEPKLVLQMPRDVYIFGHIDDLMADTVSNKLRMLNELSNEEIVLHIKSFGGSVYAGLQIYDAMMESKAKIKTVCEGYCMSMAAILLAVGDTREASKNTTIMFHEVGFGAQGKLTEVKQQVGEAERLQDVIDLAIQERTGLSIADIKALESYDNYISAQQAKEMNIIDTIKARRRD